MSLKKLKISCKLMLAFGSTLSLVFAMCTSALVLQQRSIAAGHMTVVSSGVIDAVETMLVGIFDQNSSMRGLMLYKLPRYADKYKAAGQLLDDELAAARKSAQGDKVVLSDLDAVASAVHAWQTEVGDRVVTLGLVPASFNAALSISTTEHASALFTAIRDSVRAAQIRIDAWSATARAAQEHNDNILRELLAAGALACFSVTVLACFWLTRSIAAPVVSMTVAMNRLAAGDKTVSIPAAGRRDEVGQMAAAVATFKAAAIDKGRLETEAEAARIAVDEDRARREAHEAEASQMQAHVVASLAAGLEHLARGDLVHSIPEPFATDYEKLRTDFNGALDKLRETMVRVSTNTSAIRSGSGEISMAAQDLSQRTERQAASLEETAAALEEITTTVRNTAANAKSARQLVSVARTAAQTSGEVVGQAIEAMASIETSSREIGQIIGVIDEIAFQTNLLALNAGVEAARAGDAGRGFAVVASEVRGLAQRSAEAAKQIKSLIAVSGQHVHHGVQLVGETGRALGGIVRQVAQVSHVVDDIASSSQEQSISLQQINQAIGQMDQVTQQNAAMVEQSTAASQSLANETEQLASLVGRFRIDPPVERSIAPRPAAGVRLQQPSSASGASFTGARKTSVAIKGELAVA